MDGPITHSDTNLNPMQIQRQPSQLLPVPAVTPQLQPRIWFSHSTTPFSTLPRVLVKRVQVLAVRNKIHFDSNNGLQTMPGMAFLGGQCDENRANKNSYFPRDLLPGF